VSNHIKFPRLSTSLYRPPAAACQPHEACSSHYVSIGATSDDQYTQLERSTTMSIYYHYTTPESARAILQSGVIKKSTKGAKRRRDDALFGSGVYLTQISPTSSRTVIALNNYDGANLAAIERIIGTGEPCWLDAQTTLAVERNHLFGNNSGKPEPIGTKCYGQGFIQTPWVRGNTKCWGADDGGLGAVPPTRSRGTAPGQGVWERSPQKLEAFCCVSSWFLYVLGAIVEIQHLYCMLRVQRW